LKEQCIIWKDIIFRAIESEELDYKAAQDWNKLSRVRRAKFARHCLAMANTKGGYIVVGVGEDEGGRPILRTGMSEKECHSFDPTSVGSFINRYADPAINIDIEQPLVDGKRYVVFVVKRFTGMPHVCSGCCENQLQRGAFYIRTADASSRVAYRASEIHAIIQRALRNQRQILGQMLRGILYEDRQSFDKNTSDFFHEQRQNGRSTFQARLPKDKFINHAMFEMSAFPVNDSTKEFTLSELHTVLQNSTSHIFNNISISSDDIADSYNTNVAIRYLDSQSGKMWQTFQSGLFHYMEMIVTKNHEISYPFLVKLISELTHFLGRYYLEFESEDELLEITISLKNVEDHYLVDVDSSKQRVYQSHIPNIRFSIQRTVADLSAAPAEHARSIILELCERFNLPENQHQYLMKNIEYSITHD
jgi:hypothetical protein